MAFRNTSTVNVGNMTTPFPVQLAPTPAIVTPNVTAAVSPIATPPVETTTRATTASTSSLFLTTLVTGTAQCPELIANNNGKQSSYTAANSTKVIQLSTVDRQTWAVVKAECVGSPGSQKIAFLKCQENGTWNSTLPDCRENLDVSSFKVYFAVGSGVCGLSILVVLVLMCYIILSRRKRSSRNSESSDESEKNIYVDPYYVADAISKSTANKHYAKSDITYAKPVVYSTYLNPSYYEESYDKWRKQEQSAPERLYDSPWIKPRGLQTQMETPEFKWSQTSLKSLGESGFRKLPRVQISLDHTSIKSNDSIGPSSTIYSHGPLLSQSNVTTPRLPSALKKYPATTRQNSTADTSFDRTVTGVSEDDEFNSTRAEMDAESSDGLTNF